METCDESRDNPFRPNGELAKEASEIIDALKSGKLESVSTGRPSPLPPKFNHENEKEEENNSEKQVVMTMSSNSGGIKREAISTTNNVAVTSAADKRNEIERVTIKKKGCCSIL